MEMAPSVVVNENKTEELVILKYARFTSRDTGGDMDSKKATWFIRAAGIVCLIHLIFMLTNMKSFDTIVAVVDVIMIGSLIKREIFDKNK